MLLGKKQTKTIKVSKNYCLYCVIIFFFFFFFFEGGNSNDTRVNVPTYIQTENHKIIIITITIIAGCIYWTRIHCGHKTFKIWRTLLGVRVHKIQSATIFTYRDLIFIPMSCLQKISFGEGTLFTYMLLGAFTRQFTFRKVIPFKS